MDKEVLKISVRELIEAILHFGDLDSGFCSQAIAVEGTKAHKLIQKSRGEEYAYEVPVSYEYEEDGISLRVEGRIDGIIQNEGELIIEEIKTTSLPIDKIEEDFNLLHWAQAKCYGFIYGKDCVIDKIGIQLTYFNREEKNSKEFLKVFSKEELRDFFLYLVQSYLKWVKIRIEWEKVRDKSIKELPFPYETYRKGQREMAIGVYRTIVSEKKLFARAPTGTGKTMGTIFPSIKAMGEGHASKIFYLTPKTTTGEAAWNAVNILKKAGLHLKTISLTAKEKMCTNNIYSCKGEDCPYALGYYDRIDNAIEEAVKSEDFTMDKVLEYSKKHRLCPFEFSLDLSLYCDFIICDYNYLFDPRVYLKRFFNSQGSYVFLVDEAHNLVDRGREMFSAALYKKDFLDLKRALKDINGNLSKHANSINTAFISMRKKCEENSGNIVQKDKPEEFILLIEEFVFMCEKSFENGFRPLDSLLNLYFEALNFIKVSKIYDDAYITFIEKKGGDVLIKLFCLDPSKHLAYGFKRGRGGILFSATLSPMDYFYELLGGEKEDYKIGIPSPFPYENLCVVLADGISTRYKDRENTYEKVAHMIYGMAASKTANYIAYFPSYEYMNSVYNIFKEKYEDINIILQSKSMSEEERKSFLDSFKAQNKETLLGFAVMGGIFGEGVDLVGERLSGVAIVGVGLPQICIERDLIRDYYNKRKRNGFEYSYVYPGINRVLQAGGRVIRSEEDRGVLLLIDDRFSTVRYKKLLPNEWSNIKKVRSPKQALDIMKSFWNGMDRQ